MATVYPTQDCYVQEGSPTTNVNTTVLAASGSSGARIISYLEFAIPANPAGQVIDSASLRIRTGTGGGDLSIRTFTVAEVNGTFDEATTTWNTRPTTVGSALGTFQPGAIDTEYNITLDSAVIAGYAGTSLVVQVYNPNTESDGVFFGSSEMAAETHRPMLTLNYVASGTPGAADYDLSIAVPQNTVARSGWVYTLDTTGSTGATTLVWDGTSRGTITESPTGVFSITDPDDGDAALALVLTAAGTGGQADDTVNLSIPRGGAATRPKTLTFQGGTFSDRANWG